MGRLIISTNVTLDGVVEDPDGKDGSSRGGWFDKSVGGDRARWAELETQEALSAQALLLGRRSDEWFATRWLTRSGEWADRLNSLPKYVVSSTLERAHWSNATVLAGDPQLEVSKLKQRFDGDIVVYASFGLVRMLIEHDLADELRVFVFPVVVGAGLRLFEETNLSKSVRLVRSERVGDGLVFCAYEFS